MYELILKRSARKELDGITNPDFLRLDGAILSLREEAYPYPQARKLKGENRYRLRVGDYRIVYTVDEKEKVITIYRVRHRKDVYR